MKILQSLFFILGVSLFPAVSRAAEATPPSPPPNVIIILIDDLGWTDLHCFGSTFYQTPNVDRLCSEGMKFIQADSACTVCSPSRAGILTGQSTARLHLTDWIPGHRQPFALLKVPEWCEKLPESTPTIARTLKAAGYVTASIGKWHVGGYPLQYGFDVAAGAGNGSGGLHYFSPYGTPDLPDGPPGEYLTDRLTTEAVHFIEKNKDKPFFLYLAHHAVHTPLQAKPDLIAKYRALADPNNPQHNPIYAAMIESMDDSVGKVMETLDKLDLTKNTIIIFTSDNGGYLGATSNLPLRAGKGSSYDGGTRVPLIIKWPGVTPPGSVCNVSVIGYDFYPTILDATGVHDVPNHILDGTSLVPLLKQATSLSRDTLYWHYPHYCEMRGGNATPYSAIRQGDYQLIQFFEDSHVELYDLKNDISEKTNLAGRMPDKVKVLTADLAAWRKSVGAQMPTLNPKYDPAKALYTPTRQSRKHPKTPAPVAPIENTPE